MLDSMARGLVVVFLGMTTLVTGCARMTTPRSPDDYATAGDDTGSAPRMRSEVKPRFPSVREEHVATDTARPPSFRDAKVLRPR